MIFSVNSLFSDDQAITATANSTDVKDLGLPGTPYGGAAALHQDIPLALGDMLNRCLNTVFGFGPVDNLQRTQIRRDFFCE